MTNSFFGPQQAQQLIDTMRVIHGNLFTHQMGNVSPEQVETIIIGALYGITEQQFNFGLSQLSSSRYCPTIAEFRAMCLTGSWWSVDEAWARACEYTKDRNQKITTLTKYALDQVEYMITLGQMNEARNQFKGIYAANLLKAQASGKQQEWHQAPKQIGYKAEEKTVSQKIGLSEDQERIRIMTMELMKQKMSFKEAINQAQKAVRGEIKEINKMTGDLKKIELKPDSEYWPDPFDNREEYIEMHKADNKKVPLAVGGGV
ncbi:MULTISPECIES: hypothetical protein [Acinetobacter]|uniref:hypothetical protein n=1 Tax=Acinetobacter TaxID=469 RepID=UPI00044DC53A|nr:MULTISPECIES: hypothetical protein [Acinetobacter]EXD36893.1 hypothetical protein J500_0801 [Acinetobacter sp. 479375]